MTIYKEIGEQIKSRRKSSGIPLKEIDSELAKVFKRKPSTVAHWRSCVEDGFIYGVTGPIAKGPRGLKYLNRLSYYLQKFDFESTDPVIEEIKEIDGRFVYPLFE